MHFKLSKRLHAITEMLDPKTIALADVGTDHGYLPYYLMAHQKISKAILCDVNQSPLQHAEETFASYSVQPHEHVEFRLGSGLEPLNSSEVDAIVIAGMGGGLIQSLLAHDLSKSHSYKQLLLQPQTEQESLRIWLEENDFTLLYERLVEDAGKFYHIFSVIPQKKAKRSEGQKFKYEECLYFDHQHRGFPSCVLKADLKDFKAWLEQKQKKRLNILKQLPPLQEHEEKKSRFEEDVKIIGEILGRL